MSGDYRNQQLADTITTAMQSKGFSINQLAEAVGVTYEHIRRCTLGVPASRPTLRQICGILDLDFATLDRMTVHTQLRRRFGDAIPEMTCPPGMEKIIMVWSQLTKEQQSQVEKLVLSLNGPQRMRRNEKQVI